MRAYDNVTGRALLGDNAEHCALCVSCKSSQVRKRGKLRNGTQRYECLNSLCGIKQFILPEDRHMPLLLSNAERQRLYRQRVAKVLAKNKPKVYHSSKTVEWGTPPDFFAPLHAEFGFTLDVCATPENAKCSRFYTRAEDGLRQSWVPEICWMNPPYGRGINQWIAKAYQSAHAGATVVCLVKATTDTKWWHTYAVYAEIRFVVGRLTFVGAKDQAPFPSAVVIFHPYCGPRHGGGQ